MPDTRIIVELDGDQVSDDDLRALAEIQVEEAADAADAAALTAAVEAADDGSWTSLLDPLTTPETALAIEISHGDATYRFDGLSTQASWTIDPESASLLQVKALDHMLELDREEKIVAWSGTADSAIAESIFSTYGMSADVESDARRARPRRPRRAAARDRPRLPARAGDASGATPSTWRAPTAGTTGHFAPIDPLADPQGQLSLAFGGDARRVQVDARLSAGRRVKAQRIPPLSDTAQSGDAAGDDQAQGSSSLGGVATVLLTPNEVDGEVDPASAAEGLARDAAFGVTLKAEIDTARVGLLVRARRTILVAGLGPQLSGRYLVQRVRHVVTLERHVQHLTLVRNALGLKGDEPFGGGGLGGLL